MASLLLWVQWNGPIDDAIWQRLAARATARCRHRIVERSGPGYRLLARAARESEPDPLVERSLPEGRRELLLLDRANGPEDVERGAVNSAPVAAHGSPAWDEKRLLDGTPTAAAALTLPGLEVTLTRDLMGQRNLVHATVPGGLLVASGEDVLLAHPSVSTDPDPLYLAANFAALHWGHDEAAFRAIRAVAPGEILRFSAAGRSRRLV
ncbi:MAG TPA: hypothetical protein VFO79_05180, partial [Xanthomonadales bacterium]|nr:hypothetical protein [Xanthomonadales bacterium]